MSETLTIRVPDGTKQRLKEKAAKAGYENRSDYIKACLAIEPAQKSPPSELLKAAPLGRNILQTRVSPEEKMAFISMCETEGIKPAQALRRQVRIALRNGPDFCKNELMVLRHSSMQLTAIGRNLNQVVRKIHQDGGEVSQRLLSDIQGLVESHKRALVQFASRSAQRAVE